MAPLVRIIVVNYNSGPYLDRCISAVLGQSCRNFEAVVIDNASTDRSLHGLATDERLRTIKLSRNIGFAAANNMAAKGARTPFLALLNPDAIPDPRWLERLLGAAEANPNVQLFGSLQLQICNPNLIDGAGDAYFFAGTAWRRARGRPRAQAAGRVNSFGACAAAALIRRDWFERLSGFDEDYFCYFEDVDLAFRLRLAGGKVLQVNDAIVYHAGSSSSGAGSPFVVYHTTRNQVWTFVKCMPLPLLVALAPAHAALIAAKWLRAACFGNGNIVGRATRDALAAWHVTWAKRRNIQKFRAASTSAIFQEMTWSPFEFLRRDVPRRS